MPCRDDDVPDNRDHTIALLRTQNDKLAQLLCSLCKALEIYGTDFPHVLKMERAEELSKWWIEHKKRDAARKHAENELQRKARQKKELLAKMSDEELELLGLRR